jgi:hypothetical protein
MAQRPIRLDPQHWRDRADEARANAAMIMDLDSRRLMLEIATAYDNLAKKAEADGSQRGPQEAPEPA